MNVASQGPLVPGWSCRWPSQTDGRRFVWPGHHEHWWHVSWAGVSPLSPLTRLSVCDTASGTCSPCSRPSGHRIWPSEGLWTGEKAESITKWQLCKNHQDCLKQHKKKNLTLIDDFSELFSLMTTFPKCRIAASTLNTSAWKLSLRPEEKQDRWRKSRWSSQMDRHDLD